LQQQKGIKVLMKINSGKEIDKTYGECKGLICRIEEILNKI